MCLFRQVVQESMSLFFYVSRLHDDISGKTWTSKDKPSEPDDTTSFVEGYGQALRSTDCVDISNVSTHSERSKPIQSRRFAGTPFTDRNRRCRGGVEGFHMIGDGDGDGDGDKVCF